MLFSPKCFIQHLNYQSMRTVFGILAWLCLPMAMMNLMGLGLVGLPSYLFFAYAPASIGVIIYKLICRDGKSSKEVRQPLLVTWVFVSGVIALLSFTMLSNASPGGLVYEIDLSYGLEYATNQHERAIALHNASMITIVLLAGIAYFRFLQLSDNEGT